MSAEPDAIAAYRRTLLEVIDERDRWRDLAVARHYEIERLAVELARRPEPPRPAPTPLLVMVDEPWFDSPHAGAGMTREQVRAAGLSDG